MAEKEVTIKVTTETDVSNVEDLQTLLEDSQRKAEELGETLSNATDDIDTTGVDELDSSLEDGKSSAEELSDSLTDAGESAEELSSSMGNVDGSSLGGAASEADELASSLDNATSSADGLSDSLGLIESASLMGMAEGVGQYAEGAENLAQQMNTASISVGQLATQAGIAEPQMVSLINNISNATFPQSEAMQYVQLLDQLGVSASQLGESATNMDRINDAFGIGSDKVVQLTGSLKALGVDASNLPSTFNALAYAQSNVAGGVSQFQTVLQRLGPSFSEYGYNVDQAAVITAAASQKWGTGRKAMSELSSALKDANGDTRALEQSLGLQPGALSNATAATKEYEGQLQKLADEEAEHKTWIDQLNAAWEDISLSLSPILSPLASFIGLIGQFGQFALAINSIVTLVSTLKEIEIIGSIASTVAGGISTIGSALLGLLANPVVLAIVAIVALIAILWYLYNTNESVRAAIDGFISALWGIGETIYGYLVGAFEWLQGAWQNTVDFFTSGGQAIQDTIGGAFQWIQDTFMGVVTFFQTYGPLIAQVLFVVATGGIGAIILLIGQFAGMPTQLGAIFQNIIGRITSFVGSMVSNMVNGATRAVSSFVNGIASLPGRVYNELSKTLSKVIEWGSQIVGKLGEIAQRAWQAFIHGLGIGSPGYIQILTLKELTDTGERVPAAAQGIVRNLGTMAGKAVDSWGNPTFGYSLEGTTDLTNVNNGLELGEILRLLGELVSAIKGGDSKGNISNTFVLNGDMDSEDRMRKFIDAVIREMDWDNNTAGRTIDNGGSL